MRSNRFQDFDFEYAFRTWELQKGYPVLNVWYNDQTQSYVLTQKRFFDQATLSTNDTTKWFIPINFATSDDPNFGDASFTHYFLDSENEKVISANKSSWYVFNKQQLGYYRVDYDSENWIAIKNVLKSVNFNSIHVMNRAQIIDDSFALANSGYHTDYSLAFGIMSYLQRETDFFPFYPTWRYLYNLYNVFGPKNTYLNVRIKFFNLKIFSNLFFTDFCQGNFCRHL